MNYHLNFSVGKSFSTQCEALCCYTYGAFDTHKMITVNKLANETKSSQYCHIEAVICPNRSNANQIISILFEPFLHNYYYVCRSNFSWAIIFTEPNTQLHLVFSLIFRFCSWCSFTRVFRCWNTLNGAWQKRTEMSIDSTDVLEGTTILPTIQNTTLWICLALRECSSRVYVFDSLSLHLAFESVCVCLCTLSAYNLFLVVCDSCLSIRFLVW